MIYNYDESRIVYSTASVGPYIIYYLPILKSIYDFPNRYFIIHVTDESKEFFEKIANQYNINLKNVKFFIHPDKGHTYDSCYWRYQTLDMDYDMVHMIDSDTVLTNNIDSYFYEWYNKYPDCDYLMMHSYKYHTGFLAGLASFRLKNISESVLSRIRGISTIHGGGYNDFEPWLYDCLRGHLKLKGVMYTVNSIKNDPNSQSFKYVEHKHFYIEGDVKLTLQDITMFNPIKLASGWSVIIDGKIYKVFSKDLGSRKKNFGRELPEPILKK